MTYLNILMKKIIATHFYIRKMQTKLLAGLHDNQDLAENYVLPYSRSRGLLLYSKVVRDRLQENRERNCWCPCTCPCTCRSQEAKHMGVYREPDFRAKDCQIPNRVLLIERDMFDRYVGCNPRDIRRH